MNKIESKTDVTYEYIKDGLRTGKWMFGDDLIVTDIAEALDVSRRPVLDALKRLEAEYFVEIIPQTGSRVKAYSELEMYDHFLTSMSFEGLSAYLAAQRREELDINQLFQLNENLRKIIDEEPFSVDHYLYEKRRFHQAIMNMAKSDKLQSMIKNQWDLNDFFLKNVPVIHPSLKVTILEQELIIEKIKNKDEE
ncbi:GntR family transcriptional regulator, partial [Neobacillus niacini]|uniref:GntR family transcriptional regulator n=1 Tax=Neobacillus niacini TaxID=86668 RepID=UPI003002BB38